MPTDIRTKEEPTERDERVPWYVCLYCGIRATYASVICEFTMAFLVGVLLYYGMHIGIATWILVVSLVLFLVFIAWTLDVIYNAVVHVIHQIGHGRYAKYCPYYDEGPPPPDPEEDDKE